MKTCSIRYRSDGATNLPDVRHRHYSLKIDMGEGFWNVDWHGIFTPTVSLVEMVVRGTIMYFVIFVLLRLVLKRQAGAIGTTDMLVVVLLAEVAGNGFTTDYSSVIEGTILVGTILFWSYFIEWLAQRFPVVAGILHPPTVLLIDNGKMLHRNMRAELVTRDELMAQLRENGIDDPAKVKRAYMEADGSISVIKPDA